MKNTILLAVRFLVAATFLLLALSASADMNRVECKKNCKKIVEVCEKICKEHAKHAKSIRKCKQNCKKLGKACSQQCNKRQ